MTKYMKLYSTTNDAVEALTIEEAGRLFKSLLHYMTDTEPLEMTGSDKVLYLMLKEQIDRESKATYRRGIPDRA